MLLEDREVVVDRSDVVAGLHEIRGGTVRVSSGALLEHALHGLI